MKLLEATVQLSKASLRVLRANPRLVAFPLLTIAAVFALLLFLFPIMTAAELPSWLAILVLAFSLRFVVVFFEAALCRESLRCLRGEQPGIASGLAAAGARSSAIASYTLITSTVGFVIGMIGRSSNSGVRLARRLVATAWSVVTYFALPVMIQEKRGGYGSLMRSGQLFRSVWGETALAELGFRALASHLGLLMLLLLFWLLGTFGDSLAIVIGILAAWTALMAVLGALEAVYRSAMYIFAAEGVVPEPFDTAELDAVWKTK